MDIKEIVSAFKAHQLRYGLDSDQNQQELYKWELVTRQAGHPDTDATDFYQEINSLDFENLCYRFQIAALRHFAEYEPESYRSALRELFDESVNLQERIDAFKSTCENLWDNKIKKNFEQNTSAMCDERLISCFLTFKYPQKYTFYKNDVYTSLCDILGIPPKKAGQKLVHFYKLLKQYVIPVIVEDTELMDSVTTEIQAKGYIQSNLLTAQTALWQYASKTKNKQKQDEDENQLNKKIQTLIPMKEVEILKQKKQIVLQGAPGTGKTYKTAAIAVAMCDGESSVPTDRKALMARYKQLVEEKRIAFTTFHQSMDYEEFVEGIKPDTEEEETVSYSVKKGIFRVICENASKSEKENFDACYDKLVSDLSEMEDMKVLSSKGTPFHIALNSHGNLRLLTTENKNPNGVLTRESIKSVYRGEIPYKYWMNYYVGVVDLLKKSYGLTSIHTFDNNKKPYILIIDEINRANISKVLGELITLLEADKRLGEVNEVKVHLPYSPEEEFGVPSNLYIIGTMNTADRSVGYIDYAIRRRFAFITLKADRSVVESYNSATSALALEYFDKVKAWMNEDNITGDVDADDLMVGHSYFLADNVAALKTKMLYEVIPLLREYINDGILAADIKKGIKDWEEELG